MASGGVWWSRARRYDGRSKGDHTRWGRSGALVCRNSRRWGGPGSGTIPTSSPRTCSSINASTKDEIDVVGDEPVVVMAPRHYRDLLKVMRRAYGGAAETQVATAGSATQAASPRSITPTTSRDVLRAAAFRARWTPPATPSWRSPPGPNITLGRSARWERDESSRTVTATPRDAGTAF